MQKFIFDPNPGQQRNKISFGVWKKQMTQDALNSETMNCMYNDITV